MRWIICFSCYRFITKNIQRCSLFFWRIIFFLFGFVEIKSKERKIHCYCKVCTLLFVFISFLIKNDHTNDEIKEKSTPTHTHSWTNDRSTPVNMQLDPRYEQSKAKKKQQRTTQRRLNETNEERKKKWLSLFRQNICSFIDIA